MKSHKFDSFRDRILLEHNKLQVKSSHLVKKLNILIAAGGIVPEQVGGSRRIVFETAKKLAQRGHQVHVLVPQTRRNYPLQEKVIDNMLVFRYPIKRSNEIKNGIFHILKSATLFRRLCGQYNYDILHFHSPLQAFGILFSKGIASVPTIYSLHSPCGKEYRSNIGISNDTPLNKIFQKFKLNIYSGALKFIERICLSRSKVIIVTSEFMKGQIAEEHGEKFLLKTIIIPGGCDISKFRLSEGKEKIKIKLGLPVNRFILLTVRRLVKRMGLENLIRAMSYIRKKDRNILLLIGGSGYLKQKLERMINELKLNECVKLLGFIKEERLPWFYQAADLFILPSVTLEGFGLSSIESLAAGTPVLATPVGGSIEILSGLDRDLLFEDIDSLAIARKILHYVNRPQKLQRIQEKCRSYVMERYSCEKITRQIERTYVRTLYAKDF